MSLTIEVYNLSIVSLIYTFLSKIEIDIYSFKHHLINISIKLLLFYKGLFVSLNKKHVSNY